MLIRKKAAKVEQSIEIFHNKLIKMVDHSQTLTKLRLKIFCNRSNYTSLAKIINGFCFHLRDLVSKINN